MTKIRDMGILIRTLIVLHESGIGCQCLYKFGNFQIMKNKSVLLYYHFFKVILTQSKNMTYITLQFPDFNINKMSPHFLDFLIEPLAVNLPSLRITLQNYKVVYYVLFFLSKRC